MRADDGSADRGGMLDGRFAAVALQMMVLMARAFGWRPDEFWSATPEEAGLLLASLAAVEAAGGDGRGVARADLRRMMEAFPDE